MISQYNRDGAFLCRTFRKDILTIIAKGNIDQNSKSTTATRHYHGTSLSIFQFPTEENPGRAVEYGDLENSSNQSSLKIDALSSSYIYVKNFLTPLQTLTMPSKLPLTPFPTTPDSNYRNGISDEVAWLKTAKTTNVWTAWARYHSQRSHHTRKPEISAIFPLIDAPIPRLDTQYHCMETVEKTTQLLNPDQICVDESDQPVYKLLKELRWGFPDRFDPEKYFCLFGSLHLEKSILLLCGSLIEGSGLDKVMASCGLSIVGTDSLVSGNHIKRARYCIQIATCVMFSLLTSAHEKSGDKDPVLQWLKNPIEEREMCHYWYIIIDLMLNFSIFVRSIRE